MAKRPVRAKRDRWSDWAVIGALVVALLLGWAVKTVAEGQRSTYTHEELGFTVEYPKDWLLRNQEEVVFSALNPGSGRFKTTYQVRVEPIDASTAVTPTLALVLNNLSLGRAQDGISYRLFDLSQGEDVGGQPSMVANYAYVAESSDFFTQQMPVVVEGADLAVARGDKAFIFTLLSEADQFEQAWPAFRKFVVAAEIR